MYFIIILENNLNALATEKVKRELFLSTSDYNVQENP